MTDHVCEKCDRPLVTVKMLALAIHSGCAIGGRKHSLPDCPHREMRMAEAKRLWGHMGRQANENRG